jgi:hypothetical protein
VPARPALGRSAVRALGAAGIPGEGRGAELEQAPLDALLERLYADGLVQAGGKPRADPTHVVAAVAELNQLELAGESVRAAVEALTAAHPGRVAGALHVSERAQRYSRSRARALA